MLNRANLDEDPKRSQGHPCLKYAKVLLWHTEYIGAVSIPTTRLSDLQVVTVIDRSSYILYAHLQGHNYIYEMLQSIEQSSLQLTPRNVTSLSTVPIQPSGYSQQMLYSRRIQGRIDCRFSKSSCPTYTGTLARNVCEC